MMGKGESKDAAELRYCEACMMYQTPKVNCAGQTTCGKIMARGPGCGTLKRMPYKKEE